MTDRGRIDAPDRVAAFRSDIAASPGALARLGTVRLRHAGLSSFLFLPGGKEVLSAGSDRVLRYWDEEGQTNVALSLYNHGLDIYLNEDEFAHLVEVLSGLEQFYTKKEFHH